MNEKETVDTDILLTNLRNGIELVLSSDIGEVSRDCLLVRSVGDVVKHGLRDPNTGYWHILRDLTHSTTRTTIARCLKHVPSNSHRGIFWIYYTLVEGSLESYMQCLVNDGITLKKYYLDSALLRNPYCATRFLLLLSILSETHLTPLDSFSCPKFTLEIKDREEQSESIAETNNKFGPKISSLATISSCLTSPGDSGVALISDSNSDDTYSLSEMIADKTEDDIPLSEMEDSELWNDNMCKDSQNNAQNDGDKTPTNDLQFVSEIVYKDPWKYDVDDDEEDAEDDNEEDEEEVATPRLEEIFSLIKNNWEIEEQQRPENEQQQEKERMMNDNREDSNRVDKEEEEKRFEDCELSRVGDQEPVVILRRRQETQKNNRKKDKDEPAKRVSFHEDLGPVEEDSPKRAARTAHVPERTSLDEDSETMDGFFCQLFGSGVSLLQECGLEALELESASGGGSRVWEREERGTPEGQEDPAGAAGASRLLPESALLASLSSTPPSPLPSLRDMEEVLLASSNAVKLRRPPGRELRHKLLRKTLPAQLRNTSKTSVMTRFLRSIDPDGGAGAGPGGVTGAWWKSGRLRGRGGGGVYLGPRQVVEELALQGSLQIEAELRQAVPPLSPDEPSPSETSSPGLDHNNRLTEGLRNVLCCDHIYKVFKMSNVEGEAVLGVLTDNKLFIMSTMGSSKCSIRKCIDYKDLDTIIVGPNEQVLMLVGYDKSSYVVMPRFECSGGDVCSSLEAIARHRRRKAGPSHALNFRRLDLRDMTALRAHVSKYTATQSEECIHYAWVHAEDTDPKLHLTKQAHLMFSVGRSRKWTPGLVTLKGNCLNLNSESCELSYDTRDCTSCDRIAATSRPHTFVIKFNNKHPVVIATPDDYDMSDWMQRILFSASSAKERLSPDSEEKGAVGCGLVVTTNHLLTTQYPHQILNCTKITDISTILTRNTCCILELDCHEVRDKNGDWILYFASEKSLLEFLDVLIRMYPHMSKMVLPLSSSSPLAEKCDETERELMSSFDQLALSYANL